jgi:hypothetical protein
MESPKHALCALRATNRRNLQGVRKFQFATKNRACSPWRKEHKEKVSTISLVFFVSLVVQKKSLCLFVFFVAIWLAAAPRCVLGGK